MRVESWNPNKLDETFEGVSIKRLVEAADFLADKTKSNCPVGTLTRPIYKTGPYAGASWTSRDAGRLKHSIRVTRRRTKSGKALSRKRNIRVYAGHYTAYYAKIVEYSKPFMRPAYDAAIPEMKAIIGVR